MKVTEFTLREKIEQRMKELLEKPDISAIELKYLAEGYAELNKNDWMKALTNNPYFMSSSSGFGSSENQTLLSEVKANGT